MLHLHIANRYEDLAERLLAQVGTGAAGAASPFDTDTVIIPSAAVQRDLTLALARRHGICAQVRFTWLAQWLWQQMARLVPDVPAQSPWAVPLLTWRILAAWADDTFVQPQPRLAHYLAGADPVMRLQLAQRVAGLFDQYLTYRPEWLDRWGAGGTLALAGGSPAVDEAWQAALWRRLLAELGPAGDSPLPAFRQALQQGAVNGLPHTAHVFVLPTMPPAHLELLQLLARHLVLQVYLLNPCGEFWFDVVDARQLARLQARGRADHHEVGHRLLAGWGQQTRSHLGLVVDALGHGVDEGVIDDWLAEAPSGDTLLAQLQRSIVELAEPAPGSIRLAADDRSLEIHCCHSLTRELEVLHDRLLGLFAADAALRPGDIAVVLPDLETAAPLVDAVFGSVPRERHIPYQLSGLARSGVNPAARVLLELLALAGSRCPISRVFALLQQPLVARRFGLADGGTAGSTENPLDSLHEALLAAGVHWALDAEHVEQLGLAGSGRYTLADGLDRLFLGYALPESGSPAAAGTPPLAGLLPAGRAEGSGARPLGALWAYAQALVAWQRLASAGHPASAWPALLAGALDSFVQPDGQTLDEVGEVRRAIEALAATFSASGFDGTLTLDVLQAALTRQLDDPAHGGVAGGAVTFSSMTSLRGLPFKVVCVLGLDDGQFPSPERPTEFDLMALQPRAGDRQRRHDERNLLLDLMLAARQTLHLSYRGRSVRDNAVLPPSVLLAELLDLLVPALAADPQDPAARAAALARLVVEHPLQPFAERAFQPPQRHPGVDPRLQSFQSETARALRHRQDAAAQAVPMPTAATAELPDHSGDHRGDHHDEDDDAGEQSGERAADRRATPFFSVALAAPGTEWRAPSLERLVEFFRQPCRYLLRHRMGIELRRPDDELQDDEPFMPGLPGRRALAERLLPMLLQGASLDRVQAAAQAGTELPGGAFGRQALAQELPRLATFADGWRQLSAAPPLPPLAAPIALDCAGERWTLQVAFADLRPSGLVRQRYDDRRAGDLLGAWLNHLALCALAPAGVEPRTAWQARDGRFAFKPCAQPLPLLTDLVTLYRAGLQQPLPFFPKAAWAYVSNAHHVGPALEAWRASPRRPFGEEADPAYRLALRGLPDPFGAGLPAFTQLASLVFDPLLEHLDDPARP